MSLDPPRMPRVLSPLRSLRYSCQENSALISDLMLQLSGQFSIDIRFNVTGVRKLAMISDLMLQMSGKFSHDIRFNVTDVRTIQP